MPKGNFTNFFIGLVGTVLLGIAVIFGTIALATPHTPAGAQLIASAHEIAQDISSSLFDSPVKEDRFVLFENYKEHLQKKSLKLKSEFVYGFETSLPAVALTFDDGPKENTLAITQFLKEKGIPATFFVVAEQLNEKNAQLYKDPLFKVGIHGFSHEDYTSYSLATCESEIQKAKNRLSSVGLSTLFFRPPYGTINATLELCLKNSYLLGILWSVDTFDWDESPTNGTPNVSGVSAGDIVLLHDVIEPDELISAIQSLSQKGLHIVPLEQLFTQHLLSPP